MVAKVMVVMVFMMIMMVRLVMLVMVVMKRQTGQTGQTGQTRQTGQTGQLLTFQLTCDWQLSQFLRFLSISVFMVALKTHLKSSLRKGGSS